MSVCVSPLVQVTTLMTDENLSCPQCPKSFSSTKLLQQHQQMFHTDKSVLLSLKPTDAPVGMDRAFICETCGKAFRFRSNLAEHRSVHTALKPYVCKFCGKSSRLKGNLTKHILKHHKKEQNEAIAKDDIIVKKAPKVIKENGSTSNGTTPTTSTATATAVITTTSTTTNGNSHNNNNSNNVANNNLRAIKMEIEDPDYISMAVTKASPPPVAAKVVTTTPATPRARPQPKENIVLPTVVPVVVAPTSPEEPSMLPKDASTELDRSVLISLGFDFGTTLSLNRQQLQQVVRELKNEASTSPDTVDSDNSDDSDPDSPMPPLTINGRPLKEMIYEAMNPTVSRDDGTPDSTDTQKGASPQRELSPESDPSSSSSESCPSPPKMLNCKECGKLVRKRSHLPIHMTMSHGYPPPSLAPVVEEKPVQTPVTDKDGYLQNELRTIANAIVDLKAQQAATPRVEKALTYIDSRVLKLEKSLETALNSIYTLVQLQSGMTSSVNRLREDSTKNFSDLKFRLDRSWSPRRISRRHSMRSYSDSRDRSRSPL